MDLIGAGRIGPVRSIVGQFSYHNPNPQNIRNIAEMGGGGLMDIGCYLIFFSRMVFQSEPRRVVGLIEKDAASQTDVLTSALLDFAQGHSAVSCGTRMTPFQRVQIIGTTGRIEVQIPVNAPPNRVCRILVDDGSDLFGAGAEIIEFEICNQYTIQGDLFSQAIREGREAVMSLEDSIRNMAVIDAVFASAKSGGWEVPESIE
jgi:predicted dehydrogenase